MSQVARDRGDSAAPWNQDTAPTGVERTLLRYRVSVRPGSERALLGVVEGELPGAAPRLGGTCHERLLGRSEACPGCPIFSRTAGAPIHDGVLPPEEAGRSYRVASVRWVDDGVVELSHRPMDEPLVDAVVRARVEARTARAGLTRREAAVLHLVISGARPVDIAEALGIGTRTARFHIANILAKLGADSRADLLRIFL